MVLSVKLIHSINQYHSRAWKKKLESHLVLSANSSCILLAQSHFLLVLKLVHWKSYLPAKKTYFCRTGLLDGTFFQPCTENVRRRRRRIYVLIERMFHPQHALHGWEKKRKIRKIYSLGDILYILYYKNLKNKYQWKYSLNKNVSSFVLSVATLSAFLTYSGIVFHNWGASVENVRPPYVLDFMAGVHIREIE